MSAQSDREAAVESPQRIESPVSASSSSQNSNSTEVNEAESTTLPWFGDKTLKNTASVARDHMAAERTFLSYVRMSLAVASMAVGLFGLFTSAANKTPVYDRENIRLELFARPFGSVLTLLAFLMLLTAVIRFFTVQHAIVNDRFPVNQVLGVLFPAGTLGLVVAIFAALVASR